MIREVHGNLLESHADAIVNTVNTVGVMGKGIALQFKRAYPAMFEDYKLSSKKGQIQLGRMHVWPTGQLNGARFVINFPTKGHWKAASQLSDIITGLSDLVRVVEEQHIPSIALPPLGCGNGGLSWHEVEPEIRKAFSDLPNVDVMVFPPGDTPKADQMRTAAAPPPLTPGRAALISLLSRYSEQSLDEPSLIATQKLMYFLQTAGEPLRLNFQRSFYGPYADNLRHVLKVVEGHYISGFGDGTAAVTIAEPLTVLPRAAERARPVLRENPATVRRIQEVLELANGFESTYGLELLATVHWLASQDRPHAATELEVTKQVQEWSPRKNRMFTPQHIRIALDALIQHGWLQTTQIALI